MSYLNPLCLHFAGSFEAAVSTVNNDPVHFDNTRFQPSYAEPAAGTALNGSFNPRGSGDWRLHDCQVTSAFLADGSPAPGTDPVLACAVADSDDRAPAKLVDLDPEQQLVSQIFAFELRIATASGATLLRGEFAPAAFIDLWDRARTVPVSGPGSGDVAAGAMYQSVLTRVRWGDVSGSPFLQALRRVSGARLSVKFNVDGFGKAPGDDFLRGRVVGTIGPAASGEPRHFVAGRQFMAVPGAGGHFFVPAGGVNFCAAAVDHAARRVYLDLGNALPTGVPGGAPADLGDLTLQVAAPRDGTPAPLGVLPAARYTDPAWYPASAGVAVFPPDRPLTDAELAAVSAGPLSLAAAPSSGGSGKSGGPGKIVISEPDGGLFVRADQFVYRLNPGEPAEVALEDPKDYGPDPEPAPAGERLTIGQFYRQVRTTIEDLGESVFTGKRDHQVTTGFLPGAIAVTGSPRRAGPSRRSSTRVRAPAPVHGTAPTSRTTTVSPRSSTAAG